MSLKRKDDNAEEAYLYKVSCMNIQKHINIYITLATNCAFNVHC